MEQERGLDRSAAIADMRFTFIEKICDATVVDVYKRQVLGKENVYIIEEDNLGGENFAEYSCRVPAVYMFIGIKPEEKEAIPGLHSPEYQFDDTVLEGAAAAFANIAIHGCMGELKEN